MSYYRVHISEVHESTYIVQADSVEQAENAVHANAQDLTAENYEIPEREIESCEPITHDEALLSVSEDRINVVPS